MADDFVRQLRSTRRPTTASKMAADAFTASLASFIAGRSNQTVDPTEIRKGEARPVPFARSRSAETGALTERPRLRCLDVRGLDVRHAISSALKGIQVRQIAKSRSYSSDPHDLSAAWAERRP